MKHFIYIILFFAMTSQAAELRIEGGRVETLKNYYQIPGNTGDRVDLPEGDQITYFRLSGEYQFNERHAVHVLYAPLKVDYSITPTANVNFNGQVFNSGEQTRATYQFNSYRVGYIYTFDARSSTVYRIGFTGKLRDAFIEMQSASASSKKSNVGFVPLLKLAATRSLSDDWRLEFDFDGLGAEQGRAIDAAISARWLAEPKWSLSFGARALDGGANNDEVENFGTFVFYFVGAQLQL
jgi:hypothetical protein